MSVFRAFLGSRDDPAPLRTEHAPDDTWAPGRSCPLQVHRQAADANDINTPADRRFGQPAIIGYVARRIRWGGSVPGWPQSGSQSV